MGMEGRYEISCTRQTLVFSARRIHAPTHTATSNSLTHKILPFIVNHIPRVSSCSQVQSVLDPVNSDGVKFTIL